MPRAQTKEDLLISAEQGYEKLKLVIDTMTERELSEVFDFSDDIKKKEAHWNRDKNLRDVIIHLYEWHQLYIKWVNANLSGENKSFLPKPYNWKSYGEMNVEFCNKHQATKLDDAMKMLEESHTEIIKSAESMTNDELFKKGYYEWVGNSTLGSYCVSVTASHYQWAIKKLKAHKKRIVHL